MKLFQPGISEEQANVQRKNFGRICNSGLKMCRLAAGGETLYCLAASHLLKLGTGTLYLVPLVVFASLKSKVRDMNEGDIQEIATALRKPSCM